jgi:transcriptional regulator with XRE-family HTH domain
MQRKDNSSLTKTVGKRLTALRTSKKMSQEEFAKRVGISRGYLSDLERGVREMSLATLAVVCKKSGTTPNKLLGYLIYPRCTILDASMDASMDASLDT